MMTMMTKKEIEKQIKGKQELTLSEAAGVLQTLFDACGYKGRVIGIADRLTADDGGGDPDKSDSESAGAA